MELVLHTALRRRVIRVRVPCSAHVTRCHLKRRLLKEGIIINKCEICNIDKWNGKELTCQLDHIDGDGKNNKLENLRMLCPNCHSQTETFSGKKNRK